jgi:hypothetical protein
MKGSGRERMRRFVRLECSASEAAPSLHQRVSTTRRVFLDSAPVDEGHCMAKSRLFDPLRPNHLGG